MEKFGLVVFRAILDYLSSKERPLKMNIVKYFSAFPRYAVTRQNHKSLKYFSKVVPCSKCSTELASNVLICPECNTLQLLDEKSCNYFTLYGLPETFDIENSAIDSSFKALQRILHPDKFVAGDEGVKNISNKNSSIVNKANDTLKYPLKRAVYLVRILIAACFSIDSFKLFSCHSTTYFLLKKKI